MGLRDNAIKKFNLDKDEFSLKKTSWHKSKMTSIKIKLLICFDLDFGNE